MRKNLNIIQIRGFRGIIVAIFVVSCLIAGFGYFPGWACMKAWNILASYLQNAPAINIFQGIILWASIALAYYVFKKDKAIVCFRTPQGLSEDELKEVFADVKKQAESDPILQAMIKARESELAKIQKENIDNTVNEIKESEEVHNNKV